MEQTKENKFLSIKTKLLGTVIPVVIVLIVVLSLKWMGQKRFWWT